MTRKKLTAAEREARWLWETQRNTVTLEAGREFFGPWGGAGDVERATFLRLARANLRRRRKELRELATLICSSCGDADNPALKREGDDFWWHEDGLCECDAGPIHDAVRRLK